MLWIGGESLYTCAHDVERYMLLMISQCELPQGEEMSSETTVRNGNWMSREVGSWD